MRGVSVRRDMAVERREPLADLTPPAVGRGERSESTLMGIVCEARRASLSPPPIAALVCCAPEKLRRAAFILRSSTRRLARGTTACLYSRRARTNK